MIFLRSKRSTTTPASNPTTRAGATVAAAISPTLSAEFVRWKIRMPAPAISRASPIVETNCPVQRSVKLRRRKTANAEGWDSGGAATVVIVGSLVTGHASGRWRPVARSVVEACPRIHAVRRFHAVLPRPAT